MESTIRERVHELYWKHDINCARATLICLCEIFQVYLEKQTLNTAIGLHGAGGFRAQCYDLRPNGFNADDPPHACGNLTGDAIEFVCEFVKKQEQK